MSLRIGLAALIAMACTAALAQNPPVSTVRATIESIGSDGTLTVKTRGGDERTVRLGPKARVLLVVPAGLADVKPGAFIGVAALPGEGSELKAMEVHIFPEAMRGTGEGFRPFDLAPGSSMTNGNVNARVDATSGPKLTVTYKGGEQTIVIDPKTPIVAFARPRPATSSPARRSSPAARSRTTDRLTPRFSLSAKMGSCRRCERLRGDGAAVFDLPR